jgi:hypothetical protein
MHNWASWFIFLAAAPSIDTTGNQQGLSAAPLQDQQQQQQQQPVVDQQQQDSPPPPQQQQKPSAQQQQSRQSQQQSRQSTSSGSTTVLSAATPKPADAKTPDGLEAALQANDTALSGGSPPPKPTITISESSGSMTTCWTSICSVRPYY